MNPETTEKYERWQIRDPALFRNESRYWGTHDIGKKGFSKRIAGVLKSNGKWATQALLVSKEEPPEMRKQLRQTAKDMIRRVK